MTAWRLCIWLHCLIHLLPNFNNVVILTYCWPKQLNLPPPSIKNYRSKSILSVNLVINRSDWREPWRHASRGIWIWVSSNWKRGESANGRRLFSFWNHCVNGHFYFILDINECAINSHNCHSAASCSNTDGSFTCSCNIGYSGNGQQCSGAF